MLNCEEGFLSVIGRMQIELDPNYYKKKSWRFQVSIPYYFLDYSGCRYMLASLKVRGQVVSYEMYLILYHPGLCDLRFYKDL